MKAVDLYMYTTKVLEYFNLSSDERGLVKVAAKENSISFSYGPATITLDLTEKPEEKET